MKILVRVSVLNEILFYFSSVFFFKYIFKQEYKRILGFSCQITKTLIAMGEEYVQLYEIFLVKDFSTILELQIIMMLAVLVVWKYTDTLLGYFCWDTACGPRYRRNRYAKE